MTKKNDEINTFYEDFSKLLTDMIDSENAWLSAPEQFKNPSYAKREGKLQALLEVKEKMAGLHDK